MRGLSGVPSPAWRSALAEAVSKSAARVKEREASFVTAPLRNFVIHSS